MKRVLFFIGALMLTLHVSQAQMVNFNVEIWKGVFAAGDIDNDGDLDVIVSGDAPGDVEAGAILINDGAGNFTAQSADRVITAGRGGNIHFGDIDADGDLDIIFAGWGCTNPVKAGIALNDGNGIFTLAATEAYPVPNVETITSCGFADFDLNGLLDYYFFGNGNGNCVIYYQQPNGSFLADNKAITTTKRYEPGVGTEIAYNFVEPEVTIIDFDKDGDPDMWINAADKNAKNEGVETERFSYLFKNNGFGKFLQFNGTEVPFKKGNGASSWSDINGDGYPDMLLHGDGWLNSGENNDRMWRIFKNNAGLAIQMGWELEIARQGSMGNGNLLVDWDNDGKIDLFSAGWNPALDRQEIALFNGTDATAFTFDRNALSDTYFQGASEQGMLTADLNGDNKADLLFNGYCGAPLNKRAAGYMTNQSAAASVAPAAPTALNAVVEEGENVIVTLTWSAPASENGKFGTSYNLSLKNTTTGKYLYNPMAVVGGAKNGWRKVGGRLGNVFTNTKYMLYDLPKGTYEWTVQAINGAYIGGAFAETKTFTITKDLTGVESLEANEMPAIFAGEGKITVEARSGAVQMLKLFTVDGKMVATLRFDSQGEVQVASGMYIVEVCNGKDTPYRTKLFVK